MTDDTKPKTREWWIDDVTQRVCAPWDHETLGIQTMPWPDSEKVIHVVEREALTRAEARIKELEHQLSFTNSNWPHEQQLQERVKELQEICASINRDKNTFFEQSCKNAQERDQLKEQTASLVSALEAIVEHYERGKISGGHMYMVAFEALKNFRG